LCDRPAATAQTIAKKEAFTRRPTLYGMHMADRLARGLAGRRIVILSGLAGGIDAIAHQGVVTANGRAIGFLGTLRWAQYNDADHHAIAMKTILLPESRNSA